MTAMIEGRVVMAEKSKHLLIVYGNTNRCKKCASFAGRNVIFLWSTKRSIATVAVPLTPVRSITP